jgi:DUF971 family protein
MRFDEGELELGSTVTLRWDNGRVQRFNAAWLRSQCRCELCKTQAIKPEPSMFPGIEASAVDFVGRYALQFHFTDGHKHGAYSFDLLESFPDEA